MATNKEDLKEYFQDGDTPTEGQFGELIDSMLNLAETGTQIVAGTISASGVNAGAYSLESLDFSAVTTDLQNLTLTSSNVFGSQSAGAPPFAPELGVTSHSFFGPIYQSSSGAHSASYFLTPVGLGSTNNPIEGEGLYIESSKTIGLSTSSLTQASASSLLILHNINQHLAFDSNEIHQYGENLNITAQGVNSTTGNIRFRTSTEPTETPNPSMIISSSGLVGIAEQNPKVRLHISESGTSAAISASSNGSVLAHFHSKASTSGIKLSSLNTTTNFNGIAVTGSDLLLLTDNTIALRINEAQGITASGDFSASGLLYANTTDAGTGGYPTVLIDTSSGRFYFTGSYGGGGSSGVTSITAGPNITLQGGVGTGAVVISASAGGDTYWEIAGGGIGLVTPSHNVGIGVDASSNTNHKLLVAGNILAQQDVIAYYTSDKRLKDNIKPIEDPIGKIKQIGGYSFDWNNNQSTYEGTDFGVIAQEIEQVLPSLVQTREDGYKGVKYDKIVSLLIEAIKDQQKQIDKLKKLI